MIILAQFFPTHDYPPSVFLGLGTMGAPMAANLARRGFRVKGWNRTPGVLFKGGQALYIGVKGFPRLEGKNLVFDDQTQIQVGQLTLSVAEVAWRSLAPA